MINSKKKEQSLRRAAIRERFNRSEDRNKYIITYTLFLSVAFLAASVAACFVTKDADLWGGIYKIITSPAKLITDYFALGGLASTFFNAAVCGLACNLIIFLCRTKINTTTFAAYLLVVAHCFYGLNFVNMWPSIIGVLIFCLITRRKFSENLHIALFSTALGPFFSDFIFRYSLGNDVFIGESHAALHGIIFAVLLGIIAGFFVPAILPGTTQMHRGYNMYKAGLAIGLLGIFAYSFIYVTLGVGTPTEIVIDNPAYYSLPYAYRSFMNVFFAAVFALTLLFGFICNGFSLRGYSSLLRSTGYGVDFLDKFGMPICLINIGVYGFCILGYLNIIFVLPELLPFLPEGVGFTGATVGVVFAALTFSTDGQQPRTVFPIVLGYCLLFLVMIAFCLFFGKEIPWTLSTQNYINGLAFATGLCPFAGRYGKRVGIIAGFLNAVICTTTASMHGELVLYNGGFAAGLTALVLLPILDFYKISPKHSDDK